MDKKEMRELLTETKSALSLDEDLDSEYIKNILGMLIEQIELTNTETDKMKKLNTIIQSVTALIVAILAILVKIGVI